MRIVLACDCGLYSYSSSIAFLLYTMLISAILMVHGSIVCDACDWGRGRLTRIFIIAFSLYEAKRLTKSLLLLLGSPLQTLKWECLMTRSLPLFAPEWASPRARSGGTMPERSGRCSRLRVCLSTILPCSLCLRSASRRRLETARILAPFKLMLRAKSPRPA